MNKKMRKETIRVPLGHSTWRILAEGANLVVYPLPIVDGAHSIDWLPTLLCIAPSECSNCSRRCHVDHCFCSSAIGHDSGSLVGRAVLVSVSERVSE